MLEFKLEDQKPLYAPPRIQPVKKLTPNEIWAPYPRYILERPGKGPELRYNLPNW